MSAATRSCTPLRPAANGRPHDAAGRARAEQGDGAPLHGLGRHDAAARLHEHDLAVEAGPAQLLDQAVDVGADLRRHVGVDQGRRGPLELGCPWEDLVRQRDVPDVGELLEDQLAGPPLVVGVDEAEEEADGDRLDAELLQPAHAPAHGLLVEGQHDVALEVAALRDRECGPAAGRSARAAARSGPRSPPCGPAAARSRRGGPRWRAGRWGRRSSRSWCCRPWSSRGRRPRGRRRTPAGRARRCRPAAPCPSGPHSTGRRASSASCPGRPGRRA